MEASTAEGKKDAQKATSELFKFSAWVHVGLDADACENAETGACADPGHFHAWCRLPNQFQHADIRERALGAKARRMRQLRDPNTDAHEVLEAELDEVARGDSEPLIEELLSKDWWKRHLEAMADVDEREEFKTIERDRERMDELRAIDADARPKDEFEELERHLSAHADAVEAERERLEQPLRDGLAGLEPHELLDQVRDLRIAAEGSSAFMDTYSKWEWLAGTFTSNHAVERKPVFASAEQLESAAPEIVEALRATYTELETSLQRGAQGN